MEFDNSFDVPLTPEQAWSVLMDIPRIAPCMPGAELTEVVDPQHYKGKISVRLGPVSLAFAGRVEFDSIDEAGRSARVKAQGSDGKGRGAANATATFRIEPSNEGSRVIDPYRSDAVGCRRTIRPRRRHDSGDGGADYRPVCRQSAHAARATAASAEGVHARRANDGSPGASSSRTGAGRLKRCRAGSTSAPARQANLRLFADGAGDLAADTVSLSRTAALSELIGARVTRIEDQKLLCGGGRYIDDIVSPGALSAAFVRSPHPHALIRSVDAEAARAVPGVTAVFTLDDLTPVLAQRRMMRVSNSGTRLDQSWAYALADGEVSFVGEPVAIVVAADRYIAEDAAALVAVDYDVLPAATDCRTAYAERATPVRRELNSNKIIAYKVAFGDIDAAFANAAHVLHEDLWQHRGAGHSIEGRGILAEVLDRETQVWASTQKAHDLRYAFAEYIRLDENRLRVATPDVGGGFRSEAVRLSRGRRRGRRGDAAAPLDQMDRRPPRAFHQRGPGARSVLVDRDRGRWRWPGARRARPPGPRSSAPMRCRT